MSDLQLSLQAPEFPASGGFSTPSNDIVLQDFWSRHSGPRAILPTRRHLTMFVETLHSHDWDVGAAGTYWVAARDDVNTLDSTHDRVTGSRASTMLRSRNPGLHESGFRVGPKLCKVGAQSVPP